MDEKELFAFAAIAKEQQAAAQTAIDGLADMNAKVQKAVQVEIRAAMLSVESKTVDAFSGHSKAVNEAVEAAHGAATAIQESIKGVSWKLALVAFLAALGAVVAFALGAYGLVAWHSYEVHSLAREKADLVAEVVELKAAAADFAKRAGKAKLTTCGDKGRLCIEIDRKAGGFGDDGQYAIIKGY
jgi:hypothetical protein